MDVPLLISIIVISGSLRLSRPGYWRRCYIRLHKLSLTGPPLVNKCLTESSGEFGNLKGGEGIHLLPLPSSPPFFPSLLSPFPPLHSLPLTPLPLEVGPDRGSGERCKLSSGVWSRAPAEIEFATILVIFQWSNFSKFAFLVICKIFLQFEGGHGPMVSTPTRER